VQGLDILVGGAVAQATGAPLAVGPADPTTAAVLAVSWTQFQVSVARAQQPEASGS
jgi:hypothetical protein